MPVPPDHVCEAFQTPTETPIPLGHAWDNGTKIGEMVLSQAAPTALWSAKVRAGLSVEGARVARPILSTDGRYTVAGWKASAWSQGELLRRVDETALLGLRLADSLREVSAPTANRDDIFARAEAASWQETGEPYRDLSADTAYCVGHADLLAATIYHYLLPPVIVDLVPTAAPRPVGYTCALAIVDGLVAGVVDDGICDRFAHIRDMDQLLLRAVAYRRHVNNLHPEAKANTRSHINRVEDLLVSRAYAML